MRIRPLQDRVVASPIPPEEKVGSLYVAGTSTKAVGRARVLAVRPGRQGPDGVWHTVQIAEGHVVLYSPFAGTEVAIGAETVVVLREDDIIGVVED